MPDEPTFEPVSREELIARIGELNERLRRLKGEPEICPSDHDASCRLAAIVENIDEAVFSMTLEGVITSWNQGAEKMYGYKRDEAVGRKASVIIPPDRPDELSEILGTVRAGRHVHRESERIRRDGKRITVLLTVSPIVDVDGRIIGASSITRDITDYKRMQEALKDSEEKYRRIVQTAEEGIMLLDGEDTVTFANQKLSDMLGYPVDEIVGKKIYDFMRDEDVGCIKAVLARNRKGIKVQFDFKFLRRDGGFAWAIVPTAPFFQPDGSYAGALYMISDISHHIQTEEELQNAKAQAEMYVDLMGHDISNMNTVARGYLEVVVNDLEVAGSIDRSKAPLLHKSLEALDSSSQLIDNVRKLQRITLGEVKLKETNLGAMLRDVVSRVGQAPGRPVDVNLSVKGECEVMANELLYDVFSNLVGNAIKHSHGPLHVNILLGRAFERGKPYCKVVVEDDGPGIPDEVKAKLFNRHQRGRTRASGSGLGLYLVRTLIDVYGGLVWVEDRVMGDHTKGARFVVMLPTVEK